ncbi:hypothetical protein I6N90_21765 [Paenibacillus sp. GSMTC-2017]|uniref:DUF3846 domain-containing protein n=1 Tax=Paenibacillus sp. GSMTC-2017 TaxID=2794350 RepID=UPI0018D8D58C|nr:hypothetical protein [Paenibacillus sp. GSMTC-2017]MBH5320425.1 hypothetical protein [Paenibacillus sp. GSMTC-2017]
MATINVIVADVKSDEIEARELDINEGIYEALEKIAEGNVVSISIWNDVVLWMNLDVQQDQSAFNFDLTEKERAGNVDEYQPKVSVFGNAVFTGTDADGEPIGMTADEIDYIKSKFVNRRTYHQFTKKF